MPKTKGDGFSMFDMVNKYGKDMEDIKETLILHSERMKKMEDNFLKLETTVTLENRETRTIVTQQVDKLYRLVEKALGFKTESTSR